MNLSTATENDLRELNVVAPGDMQALMNIIERLAASTDVAASERAAR